MVAYEAFTLQDTTGHYRPDYDDKERRENRTFWLTIIFRATDPIADTPVILSHGARQCGKTTLALAVGKELGYHCIRFDDDSQRQAAQTDPIGFIQSLPEFIMVPISLLTPE